jgi:uridine monophosphate synthetase
MSKQQVASRLFLTGCVKFGNFTLKSGIESPIYIDLRRLIAFPSILQQVASLYGDFLRDSRCDVIAALPYAGLPIGTAISLETGCPMIYPRKESKDYGTGAAIEGVFRPGMKVLLIDDVATRGDAKFEAIERLESVGLNVIGACVLIDREGGARETLESQGKKLMSVFKLTELLGIWREQGVMTPEQGESVMRFLEGGVQ